MNDAPDLSATRGSEAILAAARVVTTIYPPPTVPGFYWAKWRLADQGDTKTAEYETYLPLNTWDVVEVFENQSFGRTDALRVLVSGVADSQSLENFFWGPGPLLPPGTAA